MPGEATKPMIRAAARELPVTQFLSHRDYLRALYVRMKQQAKSYSYLQFAVDLGFSRTNVLRLVIIGQRPLTAKAGERIAKALELHGPERRYFSTLVKYAQARVAAEREELFKQLVSEKTKAKPAELGPDQAEYFGEWYHPVIREMTALAGFDGDPSWIKERLGFPLRLEQIRRSLELLAKLGVIQCDSASGRYHRSELKVATDAEVDSLALIRFHQKMIEIGRESITTIDEDRRDIRAVTVTLPRELIPILKGKIEAWVMEIAAMEDAQGDQGRAGDQVIQVNVQMFPFTKP